MLGFLPFHWSTQAVASVGDNKGAQRCFTFKSETEKIQEVRQEMDEVKGESSQEECIDSEACQDLFPGEETVNDIPGLESLPQRVQDILKKHAKVFGILPAQGK